MSINTGVTALSAIVLLISTACVNSKAEKTDSGRSAAAAAAEVSRSDRGFVESAVASGRLEVQHAKLAESRSGSGAVKQYANLLLVAHVAADQELHSIIQRKHISLPATSSHDDGRGSIGAKDDAITATKAGGLSTGSPNATGTTGASGTVATTGEAMDRERAGMTYPWVHETGSVFDEGFLATQVKIHQDAIALFVQETNTGSDPELKAFAAKHLPALRAHLQHAQELQRGIRQSPE